MKQISVRGTLGDAYTVGLKTIPFGEDIEILHHTEHKHWYKSIREVYGWFKHIKSVTFLEFGFPEEKEMSGVPNSTMKWFPGKKDIKPFNAIQTLPEKYIAISAHAGREDMMARRIPIEWLEKMIAIASPIPVMLLGTNLQYSNIENCINVVGKTTVTEMAEIIIKSSGFCGPEGLPCFFALSHRKESVI